MPGPSKLEGLTWSYQPPQSSQTTRIVVLFQLGCGSAQPPWVAVLPTRLTMFATQSGPIPQFCRAWSDHLPSGTTKYTPPELGKLQFCRSYRNGASVGWPLRREVSRYGLTLLFHSVELQEPPGLYGQMPLIAFGAVQMDAA